MNIKSGLIALLATGSVALGIPSELQVPKNLAVDFRDAAYSNLAGQSPFYTAMDGLNIWSYNPPPYTPFTWSSKFGLGNVPGPEPVLGQGSFPVPIAGPSEFSIDIAGVNGIWFDDMTAPLKIVDGNTFGTSITVTPDAFGDAFVPLTMKPNAEVTIESGKFGTFAIAGFTKSVPETGMFSVFAATLAGIFLFKRKTRPTA
jgi:hypothetical protein